MKKYILFTIFCLLVLNLVPARAQRGLFKAGLAAGRKADGYYTATNEGRTLYKFEDFQKEAKKQGYLLDPQYYTKTIHRFGDIATTVSRVLFIPESEYPSYLYSNMVKGWEAAVPYEDLSSTGMVNLYYPGKDESTGRAHRFWLFKNARWSGPVTPDGAIEGTGYGFLKSDIALCCFRGRFMDGIPVGLVDFRWVFWDGKPVTFNHLALQTYPSLTGEPGVDGWVWYLEGERYGFFCGLTGAEIDPSVPAVTAGFRADAATGEKYATVKDDKGLEWKMNTSGELYEYSEEQKHIIAERRAEKTRLRQAAARIAAEKRRQAAYAAALGLLPTEVLTGEGLHFCPDCGAKGLIVCPECGGEGVKDSGSGVWVYDEALDMRYYEPELVPCTACSGVGYLLCPHCHGYKQVSDEETIQ